MKSLLAFLLFAASAASAQPLNVLTFNIRLNTSSDGENAWPFRKDKAASQILFHQVHLLGVQEALHDQMVDLQQRLPSFKYAGVGRDDGKTAGEYSAVFYDTTRLIALQSATFWLSLTPEVPGSKSWDAAITRIVTWVHFRDRKTKKDFYAFNTHFDHMGKVARAESARLLLKKVKDIAGKKPVIVMGDFNAEPEAEPIQILVDPANPDKLINSIGLSKTPHYGPTGTFNGFKNAELSDQPIDHIFLKNGGKVWQHATLSQTWKGRFSSDHFPVLATIEF